MRGRAAGELGESTRTDGPELSRGRGRVQEGMYKRETTRPQSDSGYALDQNQMAVGPVRFLLRGPSAVEMYGRTIQ